jgi:3-phenylpropionate/trans-cinnamate dioxygenase ferredoxin reductase subunit
MHSDSQIQDPMTNPERSHFDVLIVGGGHAGAQTALVLRNLKYAGSIAIVTEEPELPYERPPLSKDYLAGTKPFERLLLRPPAFWSERDVRIVTDRRIVRIDPVHKHAIAADGTALSYGTLVWAAGGRPRKLVCEGADLSGIHTIRTRADIDTIGAQLPRVQNVVIVGGGYIGLEAAAVMSKFGKHVTLLEMQPRILSRVAGPEISEFFAREHRNHGVDIRTGVAIERIEGDSAVTAVLLANGERLPADLVIVGIGIVPNVEPLLEVGAIGSNGVHVDEFCKTSLPDVYAIGDCAAHVNVFAGNERIRLESVQNANEQGMTVAKLLTGTPTPYRSVPWFWSDQYDLKLQTAGLALGYDTTTTQGDPATRSFSVSYLKNGKLIAMDCVNSVKEYVQARKMLNELSMKN